MCLHCRPAKPGSLACSGGINRRNFLRAAGTATLAALLAGCEGLWQKAAPPSAMPRAPAPDLGAELFPDALGRPIADPADAPVIILPRTAWTTAKPDLANIDLMDGIARITVHHTAGNSPWTSDAWRPTARELATIRAFHTGPPPENRGWADIAYHFVVDRAARVWQARPLVYRGAHVRGHNEHNVGIVLLGNFDLQRPSVPQLTALTDFLTFLRHLYAIPVSEIFTHGELVTTGCPGKSLQDYLNRLRSAWA